MIRPATSQKLREAFIRAAREMLAGTETPLELRKVAERVGKSRTAPYLVFGKTEEGGGLEALRVAVAADGLHDLLDALQRARASTSQPDTALHEVARAYIEFAREQPRLFRLMFGPEVARAIAEFGTRPSQRPEVPQLMRARFEAADLIQELVESCQQVDAMGPGDPRALAIGVWAMLHGTAMLLLDGQLALTGEGPQPGEAAAIVTAFFIQEGAQPITTAEEALSVAQVARGLEPRTPETTSALRRARHARRVFDGSRILWIADRPDRTAAEQRTFEALGAKVARARDTLEALEELHALQLGPSPGSFDLIVSDIARHDSRTSGTDELPLLKRAAPTTPVLFYVAKLEPGAAPPAGALGITDDPSDLMHLVLDVFERKRA